VRVRLNGAALTQLVASLFAVQLALRKHRPPRRTFADPASLTPLSRGREELIERLHARFSGGLSASLRGAELPLDLRRLTARQEL